jgi:hypothetical protein
VESVVKILAFVAGLKIYSHFTTVKQPLIFNENKYGVPNGVPGFKRWPYKRVRGGMKRFTIILILSAFGETSPFGGFTAQYQAPFFENCAYASLVAYYKLDDNAANTTVVDEQGFSNGTASKNTNLLHVPGSVDGALFFNNTYPTGKDYVNLNNSFKAVFGNAAGNAGFTASFLAKATDYRGTILGTVNQTTLCSIDIATLFLGMNMPSHSFTKGVAIPPSLKNVWALYVVWAKQEAQNLHVKLIANNTVYLDEVVKDFILTSWDDYPSKYYGPLFLSAFNQFNVSSTPIELFNCSLDEVKIFNHPLTDKEITALFESYGIKTDQTVRNRDDGRPDGEH